VISWKKLGSSIGGRARFLKPFLSVMSLSVYHLVEVKNLLHAKCNLTQFLNRAMLHKDSEF
jgi:hypothetical protein